MLSCGLYHSMLSNFFQTLPRLQLEDFHILDKVGHKAGKNREALLGAEASGEMYYKPTEKEI
jgi:hypothetical protein